jgi:lipid-A-disaccharide synthase
MSKVFVVAGETSGDLVGSWFVCNKMSSMLPNVRHIEGVGGEALAAAGVRLYRSYSELNLVGLFEIIKKLPEIFRFMCELIEYIIAENFTHVILVDFPGFNLRLARRLKQCNPAIKIIYLSPPQLWCWGQWKLKTLQAVSDELVVLFPFEVGWYKQHGMTVRYLGNPVFDRLVSAMRQPHEQLFRLGVFPGSRRQEIELFVPVLSEVIAQLVQQFPALEIVVFEAPHIDKQLLEPLLAVAPGQVKLVPPASRVAIMQTCAVALTKAGTVTLELGLLRVPTIIFYKAYWLTYWLAKKLVSIDRMGLPNIITKQDLMPEFIQQDCTLINLVVAVNRLLTLWQKNGIMYSEERKKFIVLERLFSQTP